MNDHSKHLEEVLKPFCKHFHLSMKVFRKTRGSDLWVIDFRGNQRENKFIRHLNTKGEGLITKTLRRQFTHVKLLGGFAGGGFTMQLGGEK